MPSPPAALVNYQQLAQDLYLEGLNDADKNKTKARSSSILMTGQWMGAVAAAP